MTDNELFIINAILDRSVINDIDINGDDDGLDEIHGVVIDVCTFLTCSSFVSLPLNN